MAKQIARRLNSQTGLGLNWSDNHKFQDGLIHNRGQVVVHEIGLACTCRSGDSSESVIGGSGSINCTKCESGIMYRQPRQIMGLITSIGYQRQLAEVGFIAPGDCLLSVSPNLKNPPADFDKIIFTWPENVNDGQVIIRGAESKINDYLESNEDRLHYKAAKSIYVEDEDGKVYSEDSDFYLNDRKIVWLNPPLNNKRYTIKYMAYIEWIVYNSPFSRRDRDESIGYKVSLRKKHITNFRDSLDDNIMNKEYFKSKVSA